MRSLFAMFGAAAAAAVLGIAGIAGIGGIGACNALSGAGDLGVCEGPACANPSGLDASVDGATADGSSGNVTDSGLLADGALPPTCTDGTKACEGNTLATCVGTTWSRMACPEACAGGLPNAACAPWPSCRNASGMTCGTSKAGNCCETKPLPGGTFKRQNSNSLTAMVSPFSLDAYEVTVGRFRAFVDAKGGTASTPPTVGAAAHPKIANSGWLQAWDSFLPPSTTSLRSLLNGGTWTDAPGANEQRPLSNVSWFVAFAFCAWDGGRLPTYAEASFAATGGDEQRVYPWSNPPSSTTIAAANAAYTCNFSSPPYTCPPAACTVGGTTPCDPTACATAGGTCVAPACYGCEQSKDIAAVGSLTAGVGRWGHFDLAGNVAELVLDAHPKTTSGLPGTCNDCASLMAADPNGPLPSANDDFDYFVVGGGWGSPSNELQASQLRNAKWNEHDDDVGFRCARDVP